VLSDLSLPGFSGQRALELLRGRDVDLPFIYVSATLGEEAAVEALRNGATDYILKQNPTRLASAVRRALAEAEAVRAKRRAEAELIRAQRFESLAMLAGGLSHDLRNLLQPLLLAGDSLQDYQDDPRLARLGSLVRDCGRRGLQMVQSMLSFARGARRADQVRLGALLDALGLLLRGSVPKGVRMEVQISDRELTFEGNHTELQQALLNLCLNAIQAMPEGGLLRVEAADCELTDEFFQAGEDPHPGRYLCLVVADTGQGMPPEVRERLFEPFFTTKESGTGLGLLSCQRIVASHGGVMRLESEPGKGTAFHLYIPLDEPTAEVADQEEESETLLGEAERVLVVVEEAGPLSLLVDILDGYGYQPHASQSGTAALQWIEAHGVPDLVVMDADMNLFTGVRTLAALIEHGYRHAVLLLARPEAPPDLEVLPALVRLYLVDKPIDTQQLLRTMRQALDGHGAGSGS
jgi:signal transduction histidine kinase